MKPNEYQERARITATWESKEVALTDISLSIIGEVGEVCNVLKKEIGAREEFLQKLHQQLIEEIGDVFWYISAYLDLEGMSLGILIDTAIGTVPMDPETKLLDLAINMAYDAADIAIDIEAGLKDQALRHLRGLMRCLLLLAEQRGISLDEIYKLNIAKIEKRYAEGTVREHD